MSKYKKGDRVVILKSIFYFVQINSIGTVTGYGDTEYIIMVDFSDDLQNYPFYLNEITPLTKLHKVLL